MTHNWVIWEGLTRGAGVNMIKTLYEILKELRIYENN